MTEVQFQKSNTNKGFFIGILIILCVILGYVFFVSPLANEVFELKADVLEKSSALEQANADITHINDSDAKLGTASEVEKRNILNMIPVGANQDDVIREVKKATEKNNVILNSLSFSKAPSVKSGVGVLKLNASFESSYVDLVGFLRDLEHGSRLLKVDSINVQVNRLALGGERVNFSLTMEAFYQN